MGNSMQQSQIENIESLKHLIRFLCLHQKKLHEKILEASKIAGQEWAIDTRDFLLGKIPIIQGTQNQLDLEKIGNQTVNLKLIKKAVDIMLERQGK